MTDLIKQKLNSFLFWSFVGVIGLVGVVSGAAIAVYNWVRR